MIIIEVKQIIFVTGNQRKLKDAQRVLDKFGIAVTQSPLSLDEIQSPDPIVISNHKAAQAFNLIKAAIVVNDASWSIPALNGFPGGYLKDILQWFGVSEFLAIMSTHKDRRICITETVVFTNGEKPVVFSVDIWGTLLETPRGPGNAIEQLAEFNGHTLGEHHENKTIVSSNNVWEQFGKWYAISSETADANHEI